jgi:triacylglycerol lipase
MATHPIILAPGIARFDALLRRLLRDEDGDDDRTHYFRCIRSTLTAAGFTVFHGSVPWAAGVIVRAKALRENVEQVLEAAGTGKVHIIAHSMGGLDARRMLYDGRADRLHERVASLTTIGTPHNGTSFADWGLADAGDALAVLDHLGITSIDGFRDLTTTACRAFNDEAKEFERGCGVAFRAYAGAQTLPYVFEPFKASWRIINEREGANDGMVAVSSARWRDDVAAPEVINADHLNEIGWWEPNDTGLFTWPPRPAGGESPGALEARVRGLYLDIARDLAARFPVGEPPAVTRA